MAVQSAAARPLIIALSACLALGASPVGGDARAATERHVRSSLQSPSHEFQKAPAPSLRKQREEPRQSGISREAIDRFRDKVLDLQREARLRRGLTAEETLDEKYERLSGLHRRRDEYKLQARRREWERQRALREEEREYTREDQGAPSPASSFLSEPVDDPMLRQRRMPIDKESTEDCEDCANGIFFSALSPGIINPTGDDAFTFYCAGIRDLVNSQPIAKDPLVLRDCFKVIFENQIRVEQDTDRTTPFGLSDAREIFWEWDILDEYRETARLPSVSNLNWDWYMESRKYKKGKKPRINHHNPQKPLQVWDFRPGPNNINDPDRLTPLEDRTWRPEAQLGEPDLCVEPILTANGTLREFNQMQFARCSDRNKKRERQVWIYCFNAFDCDDVNVNPPDFRITVTCEETEEEDLKGCDEGDREINLEDQELKEGQAVPESFWEDLGACENDPDPNKKFGKSLVYLLPDGEKDNDDGMEIELIYGVPTGADPADNTTRSRDCSFNDADAILRVYRKLDNDNWECAVIAKTDCENAEGELVEVEVTENSNRDFLIVVSSDGTDTLAWAGDNGEDEPKDLEDFDMKIVCTTITDDKGELPDTDPTDDDALYCFASTRLNVDEDDGTLPEDFEEERTPCVWEEVDIAQEQQANLNTVWRYVDPRGINATVNVESLCDNDGKNFGLETLIRIYKVDEEAADIYECVQSDLFDCSLDDSQDVSYDLQTTHKYLIVATGAITVEDCENTVFDCQ